MTTISDPLYKKALLRLAADATGAGHLARADARGIAVNPACGDSVAMEIAWEGDRIAALAHVTTGCLLTQASAAILGAAAPGCSRAELKRLAGTVALMLKGGAAPPTPFAAYAAFDGAAALPGRHACVLLPIKALCEALEPGEPGA